MRLYFRLLLTNLAISGLVGTILKFRSPICSKTAAKNSLQKFSSLISSGTLNPQANVEKKVEKSVKPVL